MNYDESMGHAHDIWRARLYEGETIEATYSLFDSVGLTYGMISFVTLVGDKSVKHPDLHVEYKVYPFDRFGNIERQHVCKFTVDGVVLGQWRFILMHVRRSDKALCKAFASGGLDIWKARDEVFDQKKLLSGEYNGCKEIKEMIR